VLLGLSLALLVLDQLSKWLVRQNLAPGQAWAPIPGLSRFFTFTHVQNTGVAFGQMPGLGWLFLLVNVGVVMGILIYYARIPQGQWPLRVASALIIAGALGNMIDRVRTTLLAIPVAGSFWNALPLAYVTDFVDIKIWPVWNVADMCVVGGVAILAWTLWRDERAAMAEKAMTNDQEPVSSD
jgi:signal peptidase II